MQIAFMHCALFDFGKNQGHLLKVLVTVHSLFVRVHETGRFVVDVVVLQTFVHVVDDVLV